jgi:hypothetical protein
LAFQRKKIKLSNVDFKKETQLFNYRPCKQNRNVIKTKTKKNLNIQCTIFLFKTIFIRKIFKHHFSFEPIFSLLNLKKMNIHSHHLFSSQSFEMGN